MLKNKTILLLHKIILSHFVVSFYKVITRKTLSIYHHKGVYKKRFSSTRLS